MIKSIVLLLLSLSLLSIAPVPLALSRAVVVRQTQSSVVVPQSPRAVYRAQLAIRLGATQQQQCSYDRAPEDARARVVISDPIGYPFGHVEAFSCTGDRLAVARELVRRAELMQADADAYRAANPIHRNP